VSTSRLRELDPLTLRFVEAELEAGFRREHGRTMLASVRVSMMISLVIWTTILVLLPYVAVTGVGLARGLTAIAMLPLVVGLVLTRWCRSFVALQVIIGAANVGGTLAIFPICVVAHQFDAYAVAGTMLSIVFAFFFNRMSFVTASFATTGYVVTFVVMRMLVGQVGFPARIFDAIIVLTTWFISAVTAYILERTAREVFLQRRIIEAQRLELAHEKDKADRLLHSILPAAIAARLKEDPTAVADSFDEATVLFADLVGFTQLAALLPAARLVALLDHIFSRFDELSTRYRLEKIKTIGDAYMVVGGVPHARADHAEAVVRMAIEMVAVVEGHARETALPLGIRIGVHSGPVVAGVIGKHKFSYDLWGATVNLASRMESTGVAGAVQLSAATRARLPAGLDTEERGEIDVKGMGRVRTYLLRCDATVSTATA
jgi:class 3 adenylate cyclase